MAQSLVSVMQQKFVEQSIYLENVSNRLHISFSHSNMIFAIFLFIDIFCSLSTETKQSSKKQRSSVQ